jgi:hypothetical protein
MDVEGTAISLCIFRIKGAMGRVEAQVDNEVPVMLEGWFDQDWGGYSHWQMIARDLPYGTHRLKLRVLDEKAELSGGHEFRVHAVMLAGRE